MSAVVKGLPVVQSLQVGFVVPEGAQAEVLAERLARLVGIDVTTEVSDESDVDNVDRTAYRWLALCLLLTREVMQAGRMPVFDTPRIVSIRPHATVAGRFSSEVEFARVDNIHPRSADLALKAAFVFCVQAGNPETTREEFEKLLVQLETTVIRRLLGSVPGGKSTMPVLRVAHRMGIPFMHIGGGVYQFGWGARARRMDRSAVMQDSAIGARLSQNKVFAAQAMRMAGLPSPDHGVAHTLTQAREVAASLGWPVVVKPTDLDRGEGVVVDIASDEALSAAFTKAAALSKSREAIVERQVAGVCHRLFMSGGKLLYAVKRLPMSIAGDGVHTVEQIVQIELDKQALLPTWSRSELQPIDDEARTAIAAAGFAPQSVPPAGVFVPLRRIESTQAGGVDEDVGASVHRENLRVAAKAAALFGLHTAGIDIITTDITRPWHETGAIINEVNFAPLFGGGEISRRHIPQFLERMVEGGGRIPVEVFVGGERAGTAAVECWKKQVTNGVRCFLSTVDQTIGPAGRTLPMARKGLHARAQALALDATVEAMVLVVQDDEFLSSGLPLALDKPAQVIDEQLVVHGSKTPLARERIDRLLRSLGVPAGKA